MRRERRAHKQDVQRHTGGSRPVVDRPHVKARGVFPQLRKSDTAGRRDKRAPAAGDRVLHPLADRLEQHLDAVRFQEVVVVKEQFS